MSFRKSFLAVLALAVITAMLPMGTALAANKAPRIVKAEMKDTNGNGLADRIVLTYSEKIRHKVDTSKFPFAVQGYRIMRVSAARGSLKLGILLKENQNAPAKPASVKYTPTRKQPVVDMKKKQAAKQLLTRNIIGLAVTPPPPQEFTLTVAKSGDGLGVVSDDKSKIDCGTTCSAKYPAGTTVTLTATPDATSKATFGGWTGACNNSTGSCTVTMDADKSATAAFSKAGTFALTVTKAGAGTGTVTSTSSPTQTTQINCGATCVASYPKDAIVTLTAAPDQASGSSFTGFTGGGCTGNSTTCNVTMTAATAVTATFAKLGNFDLTVAKAGAGTGTVTSTSSPTQASQINCGATCVASYPAGAQVTLTAAPDAGVTFSGFTGGGCTGSSTTCVVVVDAAKTVTATFTSATLHTLTVTKNGTGTGTVTSGETPAKINCGPTCTANYPMNQVLTLTATAEAATSTFSGWSGGGCTGNSPTCNVTMNEAKNVTATFIPLTNRTLTWTATFATIQCSVDGGAPAACASNYPVDTEVAITATPSDPTKLLVSWGGDCAAAAVANVCSLRMDTNKAFTVSFAAPAL